jgi:hypothetical protein
MEPGADHQVPQADTITQGSFVRRGKDALIMRVRRTPASETPECKTHTTHLRSIMLREAGFNPSG